MATDFSIIDRLIGRDEFSHLVSCIDKNALFAFSLTCKASYNAVLDLKEPIKTTFASVASSIALINWAMDNGCPSKNYVWVDEAGKDGNLDVVCWICDNSNNSEWSYAVSNVALGGHLHILEWAYTDKLKDLSSIYKDAAFSGHIDVLKWAKEKNIWIDRCDMQDVSNAAAEGGHQKVLEWLRNNGFEWDNWTCAGAARGGHLDVLKWLCAEGCGMDESVYWQAAEGGHLDIVKWAHASGLSSDGSDLCGYAAKGGYFEMIKWAREHGFPWGRYAMWWAAYYDRLEILKWVHANGCICNHTRSNRLRTSGCFGASVSWEVIDWVEQHLGRY